MIPKNTRAAADISTASGDGGSAMLANPRRATTPNGASCSASARLSDDNVPTSAPPSDPRASYNPAGASARGMKMPIAYPIIHEP